MGESRPPPFVICHLCGRKYGTKSIEIHVPQCQKKWHEDNKKLPKHLRRSLPKKPDYGLLQSGSYNADVIDQLNESSFKASQAQLIPCENCGRTFYSEKLPVHQRSCTVEKPAAKVQHKVSTSRRNTNAHSAASEKTENDIKRNSETKSKTARNDYNASILCSICLQRIPAKTIQSHLVRCNEEKIKSIEQQAENTKTIGSRTEDSKRPRTRTIRRSTCTPPNIPNIGTFDIIEPNKNRNYVDEPAISDSELNNISCELCGRKFTGDRIDQHRVICSKIKKKQRKVFDSSKQRMQGVENINRNKSRYKAEHPNVPKSNWKQKHEEFIQSIRAAKTVTAHMAKGGKASDIPPPPPSLNADYIYCQYCDRRFNAEVAERHIPKCATIVNRPAPPKKKALGNYPLNKKDSKAKTREKIYSNNNNNNNSNSQNKLPTKNGEKIKVNQISSSAGYRSPSLENRYESFEKRKDSSHKSFESDNSKKFTKKYSKSYNTAYSYNS